MQQLQLQAKNNYGVTVFYPACDKSQVFAEIAGTKTLTADTITLAKKLGYTITIKQEKWSI